MIHYPYNEGLNPFTVSNRQKQWTHLVLVKILERCHSDYTKSNSFNCFDNL